MTNQQLQNIKRITDDYLTSQLQIREELIKQIDTLTIKIDEYGFDSNPHNLIQLLYRLGRLKSSLISVQKFLISHYAGRLESETIRLERMYEVTK